MLASMEDFFALEAFITTSFANALHYFNSLPRLGRMCLEVLVLTLSGTFSYICYTYSHLSHLDFIASAVVAIGSSYTAASVFLVGGIVMLLPLELLISLMDYFEADLSLKVALLFPLYALGAVVIGASLLSVPVEPFLVLQGVGFLMGAAKALGAFLFFKLVQCLFSDVPNPKLVESRAFFQENTADNSDSDAEITPSIPYFA